MAGSGGRRVSRSPSEITGKASRRSGRPLKAFEYHTGRTHPERIELPVGIAAPRVMESQHLEDGAAVAQARASMMLLPYLCAIRIRLRGSRDLDASKACLATSRR